MEGWIKKSGRRMIFIFYLFLLWPVAAGAEHTVEHRYTVYGYVYDDTGKPLPGPVTVKDAGDRILGVTEAGRSGYYEIQLHLHNSNLNDQLIVQSEAGRKELIVQFNPDDMSTERKGEIIFGTVPPSSGLMENKGLLFGLTALVAAGTYYIVSKRRKKRKSHPSSKAKKRGPKG